MEMTLSYLNEPQSADFTNQAACNAIFSPMTTVAGTLIGLFAGPGLFATGPSVRQSQLPERQGSVVHVSSAVGPSAVKLAPAAELIGQIKEGWSLNMTELAKLIGVQRPTLYNWLKGKTAPDSKFQKQLQTLAATSADWKEATAGSNWNFLLDYSGPKADEVTIREVLSRADANSNEIREVIQERIKQYQTAYAQSREILGEPAPITGEPIRESTRKLNKRWTEHAQRLHRALNALK
jgi:transcriptional regulator with XRE-family HTH domain